MKNKLLALESPRWSELLHAYGDASDIPPLLVQLADLPSYKEYHDEPWFSLWSSLAHQGDVYSASFAAIPHIIEAIALSPLKVDSNYFQFPAWVEICRVKNKLSVPDDIAPAYFEALSRLPELIVAALAKDCDASFLSCALSALAASKGQIAIAEAVMELSPEIAEEFLKWLANR